MLFLYISLVIAPETQRFAPFAIALSIEGAPEKSITLSHGSPPRFITLVRIWDRQKLALSHFPIASRRSNQYILPRWFALIRVELHVGNIVFHRFPVTFTSGSNYYCVFQPAKILQNNLLLSMDSDYYYDCSDDGYEASSSGNECKVCFIYLFIFILNHNNYPDAVNAKG